MITSESSSQFILEYFFVNMFISQLELCLTLLFTLCSTFTANAAPNRKDVDCTNWKTKLDQWSNELYAIGDKSIPLPKTEQEMNNVYCNRSKSASKKLRELRACLKPFPGQVLNVILSGARKTLRNTCNTVEAREEFVDRVKCLQKSSILAKVHDCMDNYIIQMQYVRDNVTDINTKIPYTCCYYWKTRECVMTVVKNHCPIASLDYTEHHMDELFSETTDLLCNKWEAESSNCKTKLKAIVLRSTMIKQSLSFVLPNLEIYTQT